MLKERFKLFDSAKACIASKLQAENITRCGGLAKFSNGIQAINYWFTNDDNYLPFKLLFIGDNEDFVSINLLNLFFFIKDKKI